MLFNCILYTFIYTVYYITPIIYRNYLTLKREIYFQPTENCIVKIVLCLEYLNSTYLCAMWFLINANENFELKFRILKTKTVSQKEETLYTIVVPSKSITTVRNIKLL